MEPDQFYYHLLYGEMIGFFFHYLRAHYFHFWKQV